MAKIGVKDDWKRLSIPLPEGLYYRFKIQCMKDRVSAAQIICSLAAAYASGEIHLASVDMKNRAPQPRIEDTGYLDAYRVELLDSAGRVLNPIPLGESDL